MNVLFYMYATDAREVLQLESNSSRIYFSRFAVVRCETVSFIRKDLKVGSKFRTPSFLYRLKHSKTMQLQLHKCWVVTVSTNL